MALKTVTANRSGFSENPKKEDALIKKLTDCRDLLKKGVDAKKDAVKSIGGYLKTVPHGQGTKTLKLLCEKAGIHMDTYYQWKKDVEEAAIVESDEIQREARKNNRVIDTPFRRAILDAYREDPQITAPEAFRKACTYVDGSAKEPKVETQPIQPFVEALNEYLRKSDTDADGLFQAIKNAAIPRAKLCAALKMFKGTCQ